MIKIIAVGRLKEKHIAALCEDYLKRISHFHKIEVIEVKEEPISPNDSVEHIKAKEGRRILEKIGRQDRVIALDLKGQLWSSENLAEFIDYRIGGSYDIDFVIGGSLGLSEEVINRAEISLCLSHMTFLHEMARLIILEQIYRAFKINSGHTYHK